MPNRRIDRFADAQQPGKPKPPGNPPNPPDPDEPPPMEEPPQPIPRRRSTTSRRRCRSGSLLVESDAIRYKKYRVARK